MRITNHRAGPVTLPSAEGGKVTVPGRKTVEVSDAYWQAVKDNPAVLAWVENGKISVGDSAKPAESKPKTPEPPKEPAPAKPEAKPVHEMTVAEAKPVIAEITDPDQLVALAEKDQRDGIRKAVDARLEELTAPKG